MLAILHMNDEPKDIAFAFAIGVLVSFTPLLGAHMLLAAGGAWLFGLSPVVALAGTFINNPWTIAPIYGGSLYIGLLLTGRSLAAASIDWSEMSWDMMLELVKTLGVPLTLGCAILGIIASIISYFVIFRAVIIARARRQEGAQPN